MIGDPTGPVVVISPHLDDAVLSASSVLTVDPDADVRVVVVFAGVPPDGTTGRFDAIFGVTDSADLMRRRRQEDLAALALLGRAPIHLDHLDDQYRIGSVDPAELATTIGAAIDHASALVAPAGIGRHPDHLVSRDVAIGLADQAGIGLSLSADLPYATNLGWPSWVTGALPEPHLVPEAAWSSVLAEVAADRDLEPLVVHLDEADQARKLSALRCYTSQWPALEGGPHARISNPAIIAHEVRWTLR